MSDTSASDSIQQDDLVELLDAAFPAIAIIAEDRGATDADVDIALSPRLVRDVAKIAGMAIVVAMPSEEAAKPGATLITFSRVFPIRVLENIATNRPPGLALATGYDNAGLKRDAIELLHTRGIRGGTLSYLGAEPFSDGAGNIGYTLTFRVVGGYSLPARSSTVIASFGGGLCTLSAGVGAAIRYTLDGSTPYGGTSLAYTVPFAVTSGALVRASAKEAALPVSDFLEEVAP